MSDSDEQQAEAAFEAWNDRTQGGTLPLDDLPRGKGDPDFHQPPAHYYAGTNKPAVEHVEDPIADWTGHPSNQWELGDQMADHSDQQDWEPMESDTN